MSWLDEISEPSDSELFAIEAEDELLAAELTLVEAETALLARPGNATAAAYLQALLDVVDLHDFTDDEADSTQLEFPNSIEFERPWIASTERAAS